MPVAVSPPARRVTHAPPRAQCKPTQSYLPASQESDTVEIVASSVAGQRVAMGGAEMPDFMFARKGSGAGPSQAPAVTAKDGAGAAGDHGSSARAPAAPSAPPACVETLLAAAEAFLAERRAARAAVERLASRSLVRLCGGVAGRHCFGLAKPQWHSNVRWCVTPPLFSLRRGG